MIDPRRTAILAGAILALAACNGGAGGGAGGGSASADARSGPLECPVKQPKVEADAKPDADLFARLIRCHKGLKSVPADQDGAVEVEVAAMDISASRPWSYRQDTGNGTADTVVYPVKATYTVRTLYRTATEEQKDWIRVLNFYVDGFGEWRIGSEESIKSADAKRIEKS